MDKMIQMEEAARLIIENAKAVEETETVLLFHAVGRVAAVDYAAVLDQPSFDRSPLDGYAMQSTDITAATKEHPVELEVVETIYAGDEPVRCVESGQAVRIMTGAMIPKGADCVIRQEDVEPFRRKCADVDHLQEGEQHRTVRICTPLQAHQNICKRGEDIREGTVIIRCGEVITPAHGAVLAGQGIDYVKVYRRVRVAILATGSELVSSVGEREGRCNPLLNIQTKTKDIAPGRIYNTNGPMLAMRLVQLGMEPEFESVSDDLRLIQSKIEALTEQYDAVITTGGVSVGDKDYMPKAMELLGADILFHGVDIKPGTPMLTAICKDKPVYCLSGNPFAAAVTMELLALPGLFSMCGLHNVPIRRFQAVLQNDFPKASSHKRRFIRARKSGNGVSIPDNHSSGSLYTMIGCDCLVDIPKGSKALKAGDLVQVVELLDIYQTYDESESEIENIGEGTKIRKQVSDIPTLCICGCKNVGKTTFMEGLLPCLLKEGIRVGVIKHDGHDFTPDVPGTDSARIYGAGAYATAVYSDERQTYHTKQKQEIFEAIRDRLVMLQDEPPELILVEGLKDSAYDKIEIMRREISQESVVHGGRVLAVCNDFEYSETDRVKDMDQVHIYEKMKQFGISDYEQTARFIIEHYGL